MNKTNILLKLLSNQNDKKVFLLKDFKDKFMELSGFNLKTFLVKNHIINKYDYVKKMNKNIDKSVEKYDYMSLEEFSHAAQSVSNKSRLYVFYYHTIYDYGINELSIKNVKDILNGIYE